MSPPQRIGLLAGILSTILVLLIIFQSATQEVETQTEGGGSAAEQPTSSPTYGKEFAEGRIIVKLAEQATPADLTALNERNDARTEEDLPRSDVNVVDLPNDLGVGEAVRRYEASPAVEYAEPDFLVQPTASPNDPSYSRLYGLNNTGQSGGTPDADVDAKEAWDTTTGAPGTVVAVIDEGVDVSHPDLKGNIWVNTDEVPGNGLDDDRNGYVDDVNGYDFANDDARVYDVADGDDHGTHVAGTIAAQGNNGTGVTGVNWRASIMVLKFMGANGGYTSDAVEALNYAVANGAKISSNSWGGVGSSLTLQQAISRADSAGHLFVAAAGNNGSNNDTTPSYPASYNNPNIISVAATDDRDALASFSNFGASTVDLAAPGVNISSTLPGNRYGSYSGTSMATPHVTGVAALVESQNPALDDAQIKARLLDTVDKKTNLDGKVLTGGRLNAARAVGQAPVRSAEPQDTREPTISRVRPAAGSAISDRTPTVAATVRDDRTDLAEGDIRLYVDGRESTFSYSSATDRLKYRSGRLPGGRHTVRIVATDAAGNTGDETWRFKIRSG